MIPRLLRRLGPTWLLGLCNLGLALVLAYELLAPSAVSPRALPAPNAAAADAEPAPPSFAMPPIRQYREVLDRPLFNSSRRPSLAAEDGARPVTSLSLVGIVIAPGSRLALLEFGSPPKLVRVGIGQAVAGWTVSQIGPEDVLVRQGDTIVRVKPRDVPPGGAEPAVSAAAASPAPPAGPPSGFGSLRRAIDRANANDR